MQDEWTEKYRPKSLTQIIGNEFAASAMRRWGEAWRKGVPRYKAMVLRGEPGTGKTSAALALARDMGWDFIEMNASDHRNATSIRKVAGMGSVSQTFNLDGEFLSSTDGKRKLIILDEADNLFGREDYGGAKAIAETIKESGQPIILIVNDYYELSRKAPAVKTLAEKVQFSRLASKSIVGVLKSIADKEKVSVSQEVLDRIAQNANGDMRAAINDLQMMVEGKTELVIGDSHAMGMRNQLKELHGALNAMFGATALKESRDSTMDIDLTPDDLAKWIEEGIPQEMRDSADLARAFDALSRADVYLGRTRKYQHYSLWSYAKEMMTGGVALSRSSEVRPRIGNYGFPGSFIVMSRARAPRAALTSLAWKLSGIMHTSSRCLKESTIPLLQTMVEHDRELLVRISRDAELDEGDVAYLLRKEPGSAEVESVMTEFRGGETASKKGGRRGSSRGSGTHF